jgi:SAM-dependent methyltransferase
MTIDFGQTAQDYAAHRAGFPRSFFDLAARWGVGLAGQHVVDLGTGTGTLARGFAQRGCHVTALDTSAAMLEQALRLDALAGAQVDYWLGPAEQTGLPDACADAVTAGQCWHWFQRASAAAEALRVLRPGGSLHVVDFAGPRHGIHGRLAQRMVRAGHTADNADGGLGRLLSAAGFDCAVISSRRHPVLGEITFYRGMCA